MLGRLLARLRSAPASRRPAQPPLPPPRPWADEIADAGLTAESWVARRIQRPALYVRVDADRLAGLREAHPRLACATLDAAERVLRHEFDLLGSGPYIPDDRTRTVHADGYRPIDWYLDPVSRLRFPSDVPVTEWDFAKHRPEGADIKLPWELSRAQHWPTLGQAYRLTRDDRFAIEIANELRDFTESNPIGVGANWTCAMDIALRAINWAIGLELVQECPALSREFWVDAYQALYAHGTFVETHLENFYEVTSNHFFSNIVGLFYLAAVFDDLPRGRLWDRQCREWLANEMQVQVLPDGADYESSVPYQRLMTELCLGAWRLADMRGAPLPQAYMKSLRRMLEFLVAVQRPDGLMPQIGDADDGRLHILSGYGTWNPQDARHLFGPASQCFDEAAWAANAGEWGAWETAWWGFEPPQTTSAPDRDEGMRHFPNAGLTVARTSDRYLLITNSIVGTGGFGNHKHNDQLGFEFHIDGCALFVDPGSYVYTPDPVSRNLFRSTRYHNTLMIDGEEQNEFRTDWLFRMFEKAHPTHLTVEERRGSFRYSGRHRAYERLTNPVVHERTFTLSRGDKELTIVDSLKGQGTHRLLWHFHTAPSAAVTIGADRLVRVRVGSICATLSAPEHLQAVLVDRCYSASYGVRTPSLAIAFEIEEPVARRTDYLFKITA
jgi:hypothetical protein